ncbi:MAG TPA: hypothetical protein VFL13_15630 [Candidatus Baltobacteraceae bacterium]|nr:hypothetical protein [Candidatus Baltobacteraceae bacterium]
MRSAALFAILAFAAAVPAHAETLYRIEAIAPNSADGEALAINAAGDVAGHGAGAAFIWRRGVLQTFAGIQYFYLDGPYSSVASTLNDRGMAAGSDGNYMPCAMSGLELATAVTFHGSKTEFLDKSKSGQCSYEVNGINNAGTMVGVDGYRGFVRNADGSSFEIKPLSHRPEFNGTRATAIDNEGNVVGGTTIDVAHVGTVQAGEQSTGFNGPMRPMYGPDMNSYVIHAFRASFAGGIQSMQDLGTIPGFPDTYATAIAEDGTVVGYSGMQSGPKWTRVYGHSHAWMHYAGRMTDIGRGSEDSYAYGVNDRGIIVGCSGGRAVRWVEKKMQDLNALVAPESGWQLLCAHAINRRGEIAATGIKDGVQEAVLLVPVEGSNRPRAARA